jgi:hypothetical protein
MLSFHASCENKACVLKSVLISLHILLLVHVNVTDIQMCFFLQEELAKSRAMTSNFLCHVGNLEENIWQYAEQPVMNWYANIYYVAINSDRNLCYMHLYTACVEH